VSDSAAVPSHQVSAPNGQPHRRKPINRKELNANYSRFGIDVLIWHGACPMEIRPTQYWECNQTC
jgi:hypothetical protein